MSLALANPARRPDLFMRRLARLRLTASVREALYREMAALMRTGLSRMQVCTLLLKVKSKEGKDRLNPVGVMMADVRLRLQNGAMLAEAMRDWIPPDDVMIFEAGENSDEFADQLEEYCDVMKARGAMRRAVFGGLAYPVVLVAVLFLVLKMFAGRLFPQIASILPPEQWTGAGRWLANLGWFAQNWIDWLALFLVLSLAFILWLLPRWTRGGRKIADRFPIFSTYRMVTGISFLLSLSGLLRGGMPVVRALERIRQYASPYVRHRVGLVHQRMLNGYGLGTAISDTNTGWPDPEINMSIKVFGESQDVSLHLSRLSRDWMNMTVGKIDRQMAVLKALLILLVFILIIIIVAGMFDIQHQIANRINMRY